MLVHASIDRQPDRQIDLSLDNKSKIRIDGKKVIYCNRTTIMGVSLTTQDGLTYSVSTYDFEHIVGAEWDLIALGAEAEYLYPDGYVRHDPSAPISTIPLGVFSIGHLLSGAARPTKTHGAFLYVVSDTDVILYVGQTTIPVHKRISQHTKQGSQLGQYFRDHVPASYAWQVEVAELRFQEDLDEAERGLILNLRPKLNIHHNLGGEVTE